MARGWTEDTEDGLVTCFQVTISGPGSEMVSPSHRVSMFDAHVAGKRSCRWPFRAIVLRCIVRLDDGVGTTLQSPDPEHHGLAAPQPWLLDLCQETGHSSRDCGYVDPETLT